VVVPSIDVVIPEHFRAFAGRGDDWAAWMARLPRLVGELLDEWELSPDGTVATGQCAVVVHVTTPAGEPAVLKVQWPHDEAEFEHLALRAWAGRGAVRLHRADPHRFAMLLEQVSSTDLTRVSELEACEIVAGLYPRLHIAAPPQLVTLSELSRKWSRELAELPRGAPIPRRYVEQAIALATDLAADPATDGRLIHSDLHYFNVLAAKREDWLVIDPKPLSGESAYEVAPMLWNRWDEVTDSFDPREAVRARFHTVVDVASLDEDRARAWVIVRMVVNAMWTINDRRERHPSGRSPMDADDRDWITECVTIVKAVQD
jgi:streptomycin 6-kinase